MDWLSCSFYAFATLKLTNYTYEHTDIQIKIQIHTKFRDSTNAYVRYTNKIMDIYKL